MGRDIKPQEANFQNSNLVLLGFAIEAEFLKSLQHLALLLRVVLLVCRIDEYVVEVAYRKVVNVWAYTIIDIGLERSWCVC
jgi:hypothetical protein